MDDQYMPTDDPLKFRIGRVCTQRQADYIIYLLNIEAGAFDFWAAEEPTGYEVYVEFPEFHAEFMTGDINDRARSYRDMVTAILLTMLYPIDKL